MKYLIAFLFLCLLYFVWAQRPINAEDINDDNHISGMLVNDTGRPLPNAAVLLSANGKKIWTKTDLYGKFNSALPYPITADAVKVIALGAVVKLDKSRKMYSSSSKQKND